MEKKLLLKGGAGLTPEGDLLYFHNRKRFYRYDLKDLVEVEEVDYLQARGGDCYTRMDIDIDSSVLKKEDKIYTCHYQVSEIMVYDHQGKLFQKIDSIPAFPIYSIEVEGNKIWCVVPGENFLGQYSLENSEKLFSLGEIGEEEPFSCPEDIVIYGDHLYISDMGHDRVCKLHLSTKELSNHLVFDESVWEYRRFRGKEFVRLDRGIYELGA